MKWGLGVVRVEGGPGEGGLVVAAVVTLDVGVVLERPRV